MRIRPPILFTLAVLGLAASASAQTVGPTSPPSPAVPSGIEGMFRAYDTDGNGRIPVAEAMTHLQKRFNEVDTDRNAGVDAREFQNYMAGGVPQDTLRQGGTTPQGQPISPLADRLTAVFRIYDANGDGRIAFDEIRPLLEMRFRSMDIDGDGVITLQDLQRLLVPRDRGPGMNGIPQLPAAPPRP